jgi:isopenicillin N synthase-like dioxygenase
MLLWSVAKRHHVGQLQNDVQHSGRIVVELDSMSHIFPTVDLNDSQENILNTIQKACSEYGFFNLVNHGLTSEEIEHTRKIAKDFFSLSMSEKQNYALRYHENDIYLYGYACVGAEAADVANVSLTGESAPPDLMESFQFADVDQVDNQCPNLGMKVTLEGLYRKKRDIALRLLALIAQSLGLPADELTKTHFGNQHRTILRLTRYPALTECTSQRGAGVSRISPHKDLGTITLLLQDHCGGLEVLATKDSPSDQETWLPVTPVEGSMVINVGNILMRWTNYRYRSSIHRVVTTERSDHEERFSVIMFVNPNDDTLVEPLPGTSQLNEEQKFQPFVVGEYISCKLTQLFDPQARKDKGACEFDD